MISQGKKSLAFLLTVLVLESRLASLKLKNNSKMILLEIKQNLEAAYGTLVDLVAKINIPIEIMYHQNLEKYIN